MSRFLKIICNTLIILSVAIAVALLLPPVMGVTTTIIDSSGIRTNLPVGSVTYSRLVAIENFREGDRVLLESRDEAYAYTLLSADPSSGTMVLRNAFDSSAKEETKSVPVGVLRVSFTVPYIGYAVIAMQTMEGMIVIGLVVLFIIILYVLSEVWKKKPDEEYDRGDSRSRYREDAHRDKVPYSANPRAGHEASGKATGGTGSFAQTTANETLGFAAGTVAAGQAGTASAYQAASAANTGSSSVEMAAAGTPSAFFAEAAAAGAASAPSAETADVAPSSALSAEAAAAGTASALSAEAAEAGFDAAFVTDPAWRTKDISSPSLDFPEGVLAKAAGGVGAAGAAGLGLAAGAVAAVGASVALAGKLSDSRDAEGEILNDSLPADGNAERPDGSPALNGNDDENADFGTADGEEAKTAGSGTADGEEAKTAGSGTADGNEVKTPGSLTADGSKEETDNSLSLEGIEKGATSAYEGARNEADLEKLSGDSEKPKSEEDSNNEGKPVPGISPEEFLKREAEKKAAQRPRRRTLDEMIEYAKKGGGDPEFRRDDISGLDVIDYSSFL